MLITAMMGDEVKTAALVAVKNDICPRGVYQNHLPELKALMEKGVGKYDAENMQNYNEGSTLVPKE
jgi:hypothetical protein